MEINERVMVSFWHGSMGRKECITPGVISMLGTAAIGRSGKTSQAIFHFNIFIGEREKGVGLADAYSQYICSDFAEHK